MFAQLVAVLPPIVAGFTIRLEFAHVVCELCHYYWLSILFQIVVVIVVRLCQEKISGRPNKRAAKQVATKSITWSLLLSLNDRVNMLVLQFLLIFV